MDNAPYLLNEDKLEFEKVLDEALHVSDFTEALRRSAPGLNAEQLRTSALGEAAEIAAPASDEYTWYVGLRDRVRADARARSTPAPDPGEPAPLPDEPLEGAGLAPVMAVLLPILAGIAAAVFLLLGYLLRAADGRLPIGSALVTAGWVALAVAAIGMVLGIIGILLTAMRDGASPPDGESPQLYAELASAKDSWREVLLRRGILPYLLDRLDEHSAAAADASEPPRTNGGTALATEPPRTGPRTGGVNLTRERERPRIGYSSPGFESPGAEGISDENGEPQGAPEDEPRYSSPGFDSPAYASPDFTGPDEPSEAEAAAAESGSAGTAPNPLVRPRRPRAVPPRREAPRMED